MSNQIMICVALMIACAAFAQRVSFEEGRPGTVPKGWTVAMTHDGGAPKFEIVAEEGVGRVLAQTSTDNTSGRFPLAILDRTTLVNGSVSVRFKTISGERDQAAGIVWRYKDPDNYYIVRANALEDNIVLYKVEGGKRIALEPVGTPSKTYGVKKKVAKQTWHALKVSFTGPEFHVFFNGEKVMDVKDGTFPGSGKTGLWTKADSVTWFDDFQVSKD